MKNIIHAAITKVILGHKMLENESLKYVKMIEDTEKYLKIDYAFDIKLKKGRLYNISYIAQTKEYDNHRLKDIEDQTLHVGHCRYVCTERVLSNDCTPSYRFVFKKVKN
jgi:hypothetical protein